MPVHHHLNRLIGFPGQELVLIERRCRAYAVRLQFSEENKQRHRRIEIVLKPAAEPEPAKQAAPAAPAPAVSAVPEAKP